MRLPRNDRALAGPILGFLAIIVIGALLYTLFDPAAQLMFDATSSQTTNADAQAAIDQREAIWSNVLFMFLGISLLYIIGRGVLESRRLG